MYDDPRLKKECKVFSTADIVKELPLEIRMEFRNERECTIAVRDLLNEWVEAGGIEVVSQQANRGRFRFVDPHTAAERAGQVAPPRERPKKTWGKGKGRSKSGGVAGTGKQERPGGDVGQIVAKAMRQGASVVRQGDGHFRVTNPRTRESCTVGGGTGSVNWSAVRDDRQALRRLGYDV